MSNEDPIPERWAPVPGYEGMYEVSDQGQVRSVDRIVYAHYGPTGEYSGRLWRSRLLKQWVDPRTKYPFVTLCRGEDRSKRSVHTLIMRAFVGPPPEGLEVRHLDGNGSNSVLSNLTYGTHAENCQDKVAHGTDPNAQKTHCKRNHPLFGDNLYLPANGTRQCRACARARSRAYEASGRRVRRAVAG